MYNVELQRSFIVLTNLEKMGCHYKWTFFYKFI